MKKKLLSLLLCVTMVSTMMVACGNKTEEPTDNNENSVSDNQEENEGEATVASVDQRRVFVSPEWVNSVINGEQPESENFVICEVSYMGQSEAYTTGHVPGAIQVAVVEVEDATGDQTGAYNLLSAAEIRDYLLARGITKDTTVILYGDDLSGVSRQAYGYIYCGVENVKILNGGLAAWTEAGFETETTENVLEAAADFGCEVPAHPEYWVSMTDAADKLESDPNFKLVSIRADKEWLGETSGYSYMTKAGEPDGAVWGKGCDTAFDVNGFCDESGKALELADLEAGIWSDVNFTFDNQLAFYCGTGWRATVPFLIMYQEGYDNISVYDGGWYEWIMYGDNKVQVGDPADENCIHTTVSELSDDKAGE